MPYICRKSLGEFPWTIDDLSRPHQRGESQDSVDTPCDCKPKWITPWRRERLVNEAWERLRRYDTAIIADVVEMAREMK